MRPFLLLAAILLIAAAPAGAVRAPSSAAGTKSILVKDDFFTPKRTTIAKNTLVTWRWRGDGAHDVISRGSRRFRSSDLKSSGTHRVRFKRAGTYSYVCSIHTDLGMTGKIVVR